MFELNDIELGKLKVFNISEARASFKEILEEEKGRVIITKHGKPIRALVSMEELKKKFSKDV